MNVTMKEFLYFPAGVDVVHVGIQNDLDRKAGISKLRVYVQGSNLFTWTDYSGYNPEVSNHANDALRPGEDYCSYPLARTFSVGINFNL